MKIFEIIKEKRKYKLKLFKIVLFSKEINSDETKLKIHILSDLFYLNINLFERTFDFRVLGINLYHSKLNNSIKKYYFLFFPVWFKIANNEFLNNFLNKIIEKDDSYDDYYVFLSRSGEFFLLMHHLKEWLQNNKSTNFVLVFAARYHKNICKMFFPDIPTMYIKKVNVSLVSRGIKEVKNSFRGKNIYVPTCEKYFADVENRIRDNNEHYYDCLKEHLNLHDVVSRYIISQESKDKVAKIVKYILGNNFIFLSPESLSNELMEKDFWDNLCDELRARGYEIFCNAMEFKNLIENTQSVFLTYEESIELAKYAKAIIGMRSGFIECLSQENIPMFVLNTDFKKRSGFNRLASEKVLSGYSIAKLPYVNNDNLFEYDVNKYEKESLIINDIAENLEKLDTRKEYING